MNSRNQSSHRTTTPRDSAIVDVARALVDALAESNYRRELDSLPRDLAERAASSARRAISLSGDFEGEDAALFAGQALELMAKSFLAQINPVLIADPRDPTSVIIGGGGHLLSPSQVNLSKAKTVEARVAWQYVMSLTAGRSRLSLLEVEVVLRRRNSAAHLGLVDREDLMSTVSNMVCAVEELRRLHHGMIESTQFWRDSEPLIADLIARKGEVKRQMFTSKLHAARDRFKLQFDSIDEDRRASVVLALQLSHQLNEEIELNARCPVCQSMGWVEYSDDTYTLGLITETGGDGEELLFEEPFREALKFRCPVCRLELDDDELYQCGLPDRMALERREVDSN